MEANFNGFVSSGESLVRHSIKQGRTHWKRLSVDSILFSICKELIVILIAQCVGGCITLKLKRLELSNRIC